MLIFEGFPSEIATFEAPGGFIYLLKLPLDALREAQNQAFCKNHPSKINFRMKICVSKSPQLERSIFEGWS